VSRASRRPRRSGRVDDLRAEVRACRLCAKALPLEPRPVLQVAPTARILIAGQAPGQRAHDAGIPFDDPSGERLRSWLGIDRATFYDAGRVAVLPIGFCFPGSGPSGDLPPRPECAPAWRERLLAELRELRWTFVIGRFALAWHLPDAPARLTDAVADWQELASLRLTVLPHPSPRNNRWLQRNPWFRESVLPFVARTVGSALAADE
jgi:uracil-DNA glycosylase